MYFKHLSAFSNSCKALFEIHAPQLYERDKQYLNFLCDFVNCQSKQFRSLEENTKILNAGTQEKRTFSQPVSEEGFFFLFPACTLRVFAFFMTTEKASWGSLFVICRLGSSDAVILNICELG